MKPRICVNPVQRLTNEAIDEYGFEVGTRVASLLNGDRNQYFGESEIQSWWVELAMVDGKPGIAFCVQDNEPLAQIERRYQVL